MWSKGFKKWINPFDRLHCSEHARQTLSSWHLTSVLTEAGLSEWCRIFYSFHLLTHDTRGARFAFPFMDVTLQKTFVDACDMCVVHLTFMVVLQTREWELSPICSVCTHMESDWRTGREQWVPVSAGRICFSCLVWLWDCLHWITLSFHLLHANAAALL